MSVDPSRATAQADKSAGKSIVELVLIIAVALGLALAIQALLVKPYRIPSESMLPTLVKGQRVLVNRLGHRFNAPHIGDILVFHPPEGATVEPNVCGDRNRSASQACDRAAGPAAGVNFIKRVVAGPGDRVAIKGGHVYVNGTRQKDDFTTPCAGFNGCDFPSPITVPAGEWFMMGDNRGQSDDSRYWGPIPRDWIIGKAFVTYWPPNRTGTL
jgi:signal peptidase I